MSYFLIFLAIAVAAAAGMYVVGLRRPDAAVYDDGLAEPVRSLPPVLLPRTPAPADVDRVRFSLGLRGYRMDQVDEVLERLRDGLAERDRRIAELEAAAAPGVDSGTDAPGAEPDGGED